MCKRLILHANMEICCSFKSFAGGTCGFSYREDRSCISQVVPLRSCKKDILNHRRSCNFSKNEVDPILPASSGRQKIPIILQFAPLIDQVSVFGGVVVPIVDVECLKKCPAMVQVRLNPFQKPIGELASVYHSAQDVWKIHTTWLRKVGYLQPCTKLRVPSELGLDWEFVTRLARIQTEWEFSKLVSRHFVGFPPYGGTRNYAHGG